MGRRTMTHRLAHRQPDGAGTAAVSMKVRDLVAGSGICFEIFGTQRLKGIGDSWQLFRVVQSP